MGEENVTTRRGGGVMGAFSSMSPPVKYGVIICFAAAIIYYFKSGPQTNTGILIFIIIIGILLFTKGAKPRIGPASVRECREEAKKYLQDLKSDQSFPADSNLMLSPEGNDLITEVEGEQKLYARQFGVTEYRQNNKPRFYHIFVNPFDLNCRLKRVYEAFTGAEMPSVTKVLGSQLRDDAEMIRRYREQVLGKQGTEKKK